MYDRLGPNDKDYAEMRVAIGKDALATDVINRAFEIFVEEHKMNIFEAVPEAVEDVLERREYVLDEDVQFSEEELIKITKSEIRRSSLTIDGLPPAPNR